MTDFDATPYLRQYEAFLALCESPIERIMCSALHKAWYRSDTIHCFKPQQNIAHGDREYRADFVVESLNILTNKPLLLVVECDGHDFHEKTKDQAQRDKQRDRDMQLAGYSVLRFTGSEIVHDCDRCVGEVLSFLGAKRCAA